MKRLLDSLFPWRALAREVAELRGAINHIEFRLAVAVNALDSMPTLTPETEAPEGFEPSSIRDRRMLALKEFFKNRCYPAHSSEIMAHLRKEGLIKPGEYGTDQIINAVPRWSEVAERVSKGLYRALPSKEDRS